MSQNALSYVQALYGFDAVVQRVDPSRWDDQSPCEAWLARDVVDHMAFVCAMVTGMAKGQPAAIPDGKGFPAPGAPGNVFAPYLMAMFKAPAVGPDDDPVVVWNQYRDQVLEALDDPVALEAETLSPWGHTTTDPFLAIVSADAVIHTWDLARAVGQDPIIDTALAEQGLQAMSGDEAGGSNWRQPGVMNAQASPTGSDPIDRLIAFSGRSPQ